MNVTSCGAMALGRVTTKMIMMMMKKAKPI
jgi:hypothetical protein